VEDREFELRERELRLKEREVVVKERGANASPWLSPLVVAILAAAAGLIGNVFVALINNRAADHAERVRAQSSLIQGVIKTDNNDATCKNLIFFVKLGMLDDPQGAIRNICPTTQEGVPSLSPFFSVSASPSSTLTGVRVSVLDADSHKPVEGATVEVHPWGVTGVSSAMASAVTDKDGYAGLGLVFSDNSIVVGKSGYETVMTRPETAILGPQVIYLHRSKPSQFPDNP